MKKINIALIVIFSGIILTACKDYLVEQPRTFLSPDVAYKTEDGLAYGANGLYDRLAIPFFFSNNFGSIIGLWCGATDCHESTNDDGYGFRPINTLTITPASSQVKTMWDYYYQVISNSQLILTYSDKMDWKDKNLKNRVEGEAYFFRAYGHFYLTQFFGDIPIVDKVYDKVKLDWERNPKSQVMDFVISDLKAASARLSYDQWQNQQGRITKGTVQHLLAYAYLCNEDWANAQIYGDSVINSGHYALMTSRFGSKATVATGNPFWDLFQLHNQNRDAGNTEGLLVIQNEPTELFPQVADGDQTGAYDKHLRFFYSYYAHGLILDTNDADMLLYGGRGRGYIITTRYWVDSLFTDKNDLRGKYPCVQRKFVSSTGKVYSDWDAKGVDKTNTFYRPYPTKWSWDGESRAGSFGTDAGTRDFYMYRLAETYLIVAEALYKQGKNSAVDGAAFYINKIRTRAGATPITENQVNIDLILNERGRELFGEIPRRIDLTRTGKFIERANKYNPGVAGKATERDILLPIPQSIIDLNIDKKMEQNPNW